MFQLIYCGSRFSVRAEITKRTTHYRCYYCKRKEDNPVHKHELIVHRIRNGSGLVPLGTVTAARVILRLAQALVIRKQCCTECIETRRSEKTAMMDRLDVTESSPNTARGRSAAR